MKETNFLAEALLENSVKESMLLEGSSTQDEAEFGALVFPLLEKIYSQTLVNQICSVQPIASPVGRVSAVFSTHSGYTSAIDNKISNVASGSNLSLNQFYETSRVIAIQGAYDFPEGYSISVSGSSVVPNVTVLYSEVKSFPVQVLANSVSVSALSAAGLTAADGPYINQTVTATFALVNNWVPVLNLNATPNYTLVTNSGSGSTLPVSGAALLMSLANRTAIKKYFTKYSGDFSGFRTSSNYSNQGTDDTNSKIKYIDYTTRAVTLETKSRKIASKLSYEKVQDIKAIYKKNYKEILGKVVGQEIASEIDIEVINYMKEIAKPMQDINLTYSLGMVNGTVSEMSADLMTNINLGVEDIVRATKRNRTMFVLADSTTCAFLMGNPLAVKPEENENNPWRVGSIGAHPLFCDIYSDEHYILVGYNYKSSDVGDSGILFGAYSNAIYEFKDDSSQFEPRVLTVNRYGYTHHPQDTGNGLPASSDFFRIFNVSYNGDSPLSPNGSYDIPSLTKSVLNYI